MLKIQTVKKKKNFKTNTSKHPPGIIDIGMQYATRSPSVFERLAETFIAGGQVCVKPPSTYGSRFLRGLGLIFDSGPTKSLIAKFDAKVEQDQEKLKEEQDEEKYVKKNM